MAGRKPQPELSAHGFSLLEVLIVLIIISIILSFTVLSFDREPEVLRNEEQKLTALMRLAADEAVMNSREYRIEFWQHGYFFKKFSNGKWLEINDEVLRPRELPDGYRLKVSLDNETVDLSDEQNPEKPNPAIVFFLSSGEISPFEISITSRSGLKSTISNHLGKIEKRLPD